MSLFDWLVVCHLIGDFLLQTNEMAKHKMDEWSWMFAHVVVYMVPATVVMASYAVLHDLSGWWIAGILLFLATTHAMLDRRALIGWWMDRVIRTPEHPWLPTVIDQVFHVVILGIVAQAVAWMSR